MPDDHTDPSNDDQVTEKLMDDLERAFYDPMIGGWPLIHWEWIFCLDPSSHSITVVGEWPDNPNRSVTLHTDETSRELEEGRQDG